MSHDNAITGLGDLSLEGTFDTAMRGYDKRQVADHIHRLRGELRAAQDEARAAHEQAQDHGRDVERMRAELAKVRAEAAHAPRPQHEEVSERLAQILRLADEEADQKRARAAEEADSTVEAARDQSSKVLEAARSAAEGIISAARERAEKEAAAMLANADASSRATIEDAEARAAAVLADADRRTAQVTSLQDERLSALREVHTDTLRRLEVVRGALEKVLTAEIDAGPPDAGIDAAPLPTSGIALRAADVDLTGHGRAATLSNTIASEPVAMPVSALEDEASVVTGTLDRDELTARLEHDEDH